jgi:iduronate 2-sulfatase
VQEQSIEYVLPESRAATTREEALFANAPGDAKSLDKGAAFERADVPDDAYADGRIAAVAIERLRGFKKTGERFFLAAGFLKPHLPFSAPARYWDLHDPATLPLADTRVPPQDAPQFAPQFGNELRNYAGIPERGDLPESLERSLVHGYYAAASFMDAQVGRLLDELDALRLADDTIIVLWGDHGWHLGDHGMWCKHTNYEQATRAPLIVVAPGRRVNRFDAPGGPAVGVGVIEVVAGQGDHRVGLESQPGAGVLVGGQDQLEIAVAVELHAEDGADLGPGVVVDLVPPERR